VKLATAWNLIEEGNDEDDYPEDDTAA